MKSKFSASSSTIMSLMSFSTISEIENGQKQLNSRMLPRFLFPEGQELDKDDPEAGFFCGHIIIRVSFSFVLDTWY
jgi:hypothetical protein